MPVLYCPTRRPPVTFSSQFLLTGNLLNALPPPSAAHTDYGSNIGDTWIDDVDPRYPPQWVALWPTPGPQHMSDVVDAQGHITANAATTFRNIASVADGITYMGSMIRAADITDGLTVTYLIGERSISTAVYFSCPISYCDEDEAAFVGHWRDITCVAAFPLPHCDNERQSTGLFGSAHPSGFNMAFCDGSIRLMSYSIDYITHSRLASRRDGAVVDPKKY